MAEERVVRLRLDRVGFDEAEQGSASLEQRLNKLATAEQKVNKEAKPAAASVSKLAQEEGKAGSAAGTATPKVDKLGDEIQQTGKQAATAGGQLDKAGAQMRGLGAFAGQMATKVIAAAGAFLSFQAVKNILADAVEAIKEDEAATALLEARIRSTGGAAERSLEQLDALAAGLSRGTGLDDEAIKNAEIELQTFDRVYGAVFDRAIRLATDLGAVSGDVASEITLLGKALQDPEEGIAGLEKSIGRLTDSQAAAIIETAKLGDVQKAQQMLLDVVERRVGGTAEAYRDTLGGALRAASTEWENQLELLRTGLSPALRQIAEDFVRWSQSAQGQEQIVETGRELGRVLKSVAEAAEAVGRGFDAIDATGLGPLVAGVMDLAGWVATIPEKFGSWAPAIEAAFGPLQTYNRLAIGWLSDLIHKIDEAPEALAGLTAKLDPRARVGSAAGLMGPQSGMTDAQRKAWDEEEAAANRSHQREQERRDDLARTAAAEAKKLQSARDAAKAARDAADNLVEGIKQEAEERQAALAVLKQEGVSREELAKQLRELEIQQKAAVKIEEVRAAYLKAGISLTDKNANAIRAWVIQAERAADAAKKWASIEPPKTLSQLKTIVAEWEEVSQAEMEAVATHLGAIEEIRAANQAALDEHSQAIYDDLIEQALDFKTSLTSPRQALADFQAQIDELAKVTDSAGTHILSAADAERLRSEAAQEFYSGVLAQAQSVFAQLADTFGGFFDYLAQAAQTLQNAQQAKQSWSDLATSLGASSGGASAAGGAGFYFVVAKAMYDQYKKNAAEREARRYETAGRAEFHGDQWFDDKSGLASAKERQFGLQLQDTINQFIDSIGGSLDRLTELSVRIRNDGKYFEAWVKGEIIGRFESIEEATQAAILGALTSSATAIGGLDPLTRQGLTLYQNKPIDQTTLGEMQDFLSKLNEISELGFSPLVADVRRSISHFQDLRRALGQLDPTSQEVIDAFDDIDAAQQRLLGSVKNQLLGVDTSVSDALADLAGFWAGMTELSQQMTDSALSKIEDAQRRLEKLGTGPTKTPGGGEGPQMMTEEEWQAEVDKVQREIERYKKELDEIPKALSEQELSMGVFDSLYQYLEGSQKYEAERVKWARYKVDIEFALIKAQLELLGLWEQFAGMYSDALAAALAAAGRRPGSGGGADTKDLRKQLRDEIAAIQAELRGPVHAAFFDFQQSLADFRERAKEAKLPAAELAAGIAALTEQFQRSLLEQARAYAGQGTDFTARLDEVRDFFAGLRELGRKKTGIADWRVDALEGQALAKLGGELRQAIAEFGGLANPMLAIQMQAADLRANLTALAAAAGWSAEQIAAAQAAIDAGAAFQRQQGINSLLDRVFGVLEQAGLFEEDRQAFERQKIDAEYALLEAQLRFFDAWTEQTAAWVNAAHDFERAGAAVRRSIESAADRWDDTLFQTATRAWQAAVQDWRSGIKELSDSTRSLLTNDELSGLTQEQQLATARGQFLDLAARARGGDVDALRQLAQAREELLAESRQSNQGGSGYDTDWQLAMIQTADLLTHAQETEEAVRVRAIQETLNNATANADQITTAVYDGAAQVVAAIYRLMQGLPAYGEGGYVDRPHLAIVGDRPEYILPAVPGLRGPGTVAVQYGTPSTGRADVLLDKLLREQRRHTPALRSTAYSSGSTARSSRDLLDAETRARVVNGRKR